MKKIVGLFGVLILMMIAIVACRKFIEEHSEQQGKENKTRAMEFKATDYYWYKGEKIPLQKMDEKFYVVFYPTDETRLKGPLVKSGRILEDEVEWKDNSFYLYATDMTGSGAQKFADFKTAIVNGSYEQCATTLSSALYWAPFYRMENGDEIGLTEMFSVVLKPETDLMQLEKLAEENAVEMIGRDKRSSWYHLACTHLSKGNALEMANLFYESGLFEIAFPNITVNVVFDCIDEPMFQSGDMWHLGNNFAYPDIHINYCAARTILPKGSSNIIVAIIDDGVQSTHRDLYNVLPGWDANTKTAPNYGDVSGNTASHGTMVAGFIGAIPNNGLDVAGIAYGVKILPISFRAGIPAANMELAFHYAVDNGARVLNCSWDLPAPNPYVESGINYALNHDCIVVFASGTRSSATNVTYPANFDPRIMAVGSIDQSGIRSPFSCYGSTLDMVAPADNIATTYPIPPFYTVKTSGTSFAAPQVAAVAAMMLSINPKLTQAQVCQAIESTCTKLPGYTYSSNSAHPNGTWESQTGHGLVNAYASLASICPPRITGPSGYLYGWRAEYTLEYPWGTIPTSGVQWSKEGNFGLSSSTGNPVTVERYGITAASGTLKATYNGYTVTHSINFEYLPLWFNLIAPEGEVAANTPAIIQIVNVEGIVPGTEVDEYGNNRGFYEMTVSFSNNYGNWEELEWFDHIPTSYSVKMPTNGQTCLELQFTANDVYGRQHIEYASVCWE